MLHQIHPNRIRQIFILATILFLGLVIVREMFFMLGAFLGAITLYVLLRAPMYYLILQQKWPKWLAVLSLMITSLVVLILPMAWMGSVFYHKVQPIIQNPEVLNSYFNQMHAYLIKEFDIDFLNESNINKINAQVLPLVQKTIGGTLQAVASLFIMYLMLYFLLMNTTKVELWLRKQIPFKQANVNKTISELRSMVYSNAIAIPLVAILQGLIGCIGYWIFGAEEVLLMGLLTAICSMLPVVGGMIIYLPLGVYQLAIGHTSSGIGILLWGFLIIGSVDNIARFILQKKMANVHPLITLFGVFIGVNMFGFIGIIFGPLLLSMFILLVRIYTDEFGRADADEINKLNTELEAEA
jgi:predicted PurR-regulated permease PerM